MAVPSAGLTRADGSPAAAGVPRQAPAHGHAARARRRWFTKDFLPSSACRPWSNTRSSY